MNRVIGPRPGNEFEAARLIAIDKSDVSKLRRPGRLDQPTVTALPVPAGSAGGVGRSYTPPADMPLSCDGRTVARIKVARNAAVEIELNIPIVRMEREQLVEAVEAFVSRRVLKAMPAARTSAEVQS